MDHFEMVEKLRQKAQVSYEDAKSALEACDWDLLDALVYLEQQGKLQNEQKASYSTILGLGLFAGAAGIAAASNGGSSPTPTPPSVVEPEATEASVVDGLFFV